MIQILSILSTTGASHALTIDSFAPGRIERTNKITVSGATPGARVRAAIGVTAASRGLPGCPGVLVQVDPLVVLPAQTADAAGVAVFSLEVDDRSFVEVRIQAAQLSTCEVSNVVVHRFPPQRELDMDTDGHLLSLSSTESARFAGADIAASDLDGDGHPDLLIGGPGDLGLVGEAYLAPGPIPAMDLNLDSGPVAHLRGELGDALGAAVATGDLDGDGQADAVLGAPLAAGRGGRVYVLRGPLGPDDLDLPADEDARIDGSLADGELGRSVAIVDDMDGDGAAELLIGAPAWRAPEDSRVFLMDGRVTGAVDASVAEAILYDDDASERFGTSLAAAGDTNGDGLPDVAVGAPFLFSGGAAYLFEGPILGAIPHTMADGSIGPDGGLGDLGERIAGPGDVDGDGYDDLLVSAPTEPGDSTHSAHLFHGPLSRSLELGDAVARLGDGTQAYWNVEGIGDIDQDGYLDVAVTTWSSQVWVAHGPLYGHIGEDGRDLVLVSREAGRMGESITSADLDGDGSLDLALGASTTDNRTGAVVFWPNSL